MKLKNKIENYLENLRPEIDKIIEKYLPKKATKKWLNFTFGKPHYTYSLKAAQKSLLEPTWEFLKRGGKRWRPVLFLLLIEALGGERKKFKDFCIIPEMIHQGSLIVDDIEDQGELRRGRPCLHKIYGEDLALNVGNFLYFFPLILLKKHKDKIKPEVLLRLYQTYIQEMINISFGQGTDIFWHKGKERKIEEKEYLQMCAFKTGCLARMAAKMAAILSEKDEETVEKVGKVAEAIGVAFQIQDDILDISLKGKEREKFGKSFGNDIKEGKRTLMVIHALKKAKKKDKERLRAILNKHTDDLKERAEAISIIEKYKGIEYAKKIAKKIVKESWGKVKEFLPESQAKKTLKEFIYFLIQRKT